jgi:hypothetical protein
VLYQPVEHWCSDFIVEATTVISDIISHDWGNVGVLPRSMLAFAVTVYSVGNSYHNGMGQSVILPVELNWWTHVLYDCRSGANLGYTYHIHLLD